MKSISQFTASEIDNKLKEISDIKQSLIEVNASITNLQINLDSTKADIAINHSTIGAKSKNLLKNTATTQTVNGISVSVNSDSSITINGTNEKSYMIAFNIGTATLESGSFTVTSDSPDGQAGNTSLRLINSETSEYLTITANPATLNLDTAATFDAKIVIYGGKTVSNITFYPMIRYADIKDATYEPYKPSLQEQISSIAKRLEALEGK